MQQIYYCPNCRSQVAYGQPYCTACNTVLTWQTSQTQGQYQDSAGQYGNQQQGWDQQGPGGQQYGWNQQQQWTQQQQQQWYQESLENQTAARKTIGRKKKKSSESAELAKFIRDNKSAIIKIGAGLVIVILLIALYASFQKDIAKLFTAPTVTSFETSSSITTVGQPVTLQWEATGVSTVSITPEVGNVSASGQRPVSPATTTTYQLVANNMAGTARKSVTVTVTGTLPSVDSFSIDKESVITGQTATLSWNVTGAKSVSISPSVGEVESSGTKIVTPVTDITYTLTATNNAGNKTATASIKVIASTTPVITDFSASSTSIKAGEPAVLTWDVIGAKSINISQGIGGVAAKDSTKVSPNTTTTYTLTADSGYSSVTKMVTITVDTSNITNVAKTAITNAPPVIGNFTADKSSMMLADNFTLSWTVTGARSVSISPDLGIVPASGSTLVIPTGTTTYTLTALNSFGTQTATVAVTVNKSSEGTAPVISSFTATPATVSTGGASTLTWNIAGATFIIINQGIGSPGSNFSQTVNPVATTAYTLTAINPTGTDSRTVTVTVSP